MKRYQEVYDGCISPYAECRSPLLIGGPHMVPSNGSMRGQSNEFTLAVIHARRAYITVVLSTPIFLAMRPSDIVPKRCSYFDQSIWRSGWLFIFILTFRLTRFVRVVQPVGPSFEIGWFARCKTAFDLFGFVRGLPLLAPARCAVTESFSAESRMLKLESRS